MPNTTEAADHIEHHRDGVMIEQQPITRHMIVFAVFIACFGWLSNFDSAFGGIVLLMEPYKKSYGQCTDGVCTLSALDQSLIQLTLLFEAVGGALAGLTGRYLGRRLTCQIGCVLIAIGAAGMVGSRGTFLGYMICKCLGGIGMGMLYASAPLWGSECVAPVKRGMLMSLYNLGLGSGNVVAAAICIGSSKFNNDWSWRTPIIIQIPVAMTLCVASFVFHESPRWLLVNGKEDKARRSFAAFNGVDSSSGLITMQINDVQAHIQIEKSLQSGSWTDIFHGEGLRRTHLAVLALLCVALTGVQFIIPYAALFLSEIGIRNPYVLNVAISAGILVGSAFGPFACEYLGRRLTLLGGLTGMGLCMLIVAVVNSAVGQTSTSQITLVVFLCLWSVIFGTTVGPGSWVSSAELHSISLRTSGQAYAVTIYQIFSFGAAFWTPYMLNADYGDMGMNVGYFYFGTTIVLGTLTYLSIPETGRLSLEQIDNLFTSKVPARKTSLAKNKMIAAQEVFTGEADAQAKAVGL